MHRCKRRMQLLTIVNHYVLNIHYQLLHFDNCAYCSGVAFSLGIAIKFKMLSYNMFQSK